MSITYITGIPGGGKTYYAVYLIYKNFIAKPRKKYIFFGDIIKNDKYIYCYTNINQFRFDKCERIKKYEHDIFYEQLKMLYLMFLNKCSDDELIAKAKEFKIFKCLYVLDESHNIYNDKFDDVLGWFLTYHRHLYIDIVFITQDMSLICTKYKAIAEFFIKAIEPAKRFSKKSFRYRNYLSYRYSEKSKDSAFNIPHLKEIFELYVSGSKSDTKSLTRKYFLISFILLLILFFSFTYFINSISPNSIENKKTKNVNFQTPTNTNKKISLNNSLNTKPIEEKKINKNNYSDLYIYKIICVNRKNCIINNKDNIDYEVLQYILLNSEKIYSNNSYSDATTTKITLIYDFDIFKNFIEKKGKDLKNEKDGNSLFGIR